LFNLDGFIDSFIHPNTETPFPLPILFFFISSQIKVFVTSLFEYNVNLVKFKTEVRDFLIQLNEFAGDTDDLYIEEKEAELEQQRKLKLAKALAIPGMVKPADLPSAMDEDGGS
jgi:exportin-1